MIRVAEQQNELETLQRLSAKWQEAAKEALVMLRELIGRPLSRLNNNHNNIVSRTTLELARNQEDANNEGRYRTSTLKEICHQLHIDPSAIGVYNEEEDTFN